jgi:hypothetical protein
MQNAQWGALEEKSWNLELKPITSGTKQVVQDHKLFYNLHIAPWGLTWYYLIRKVRKEQKL